MSDAYRQQILDEEHLRLLRIGYFVFGGTALFIVPFGLLYMGMGVFFSSFLGGLPQRGTQGPPPEFVGFLFAGIGGFVVFAAGGFATLAFLTARALRLRRSRTLCLITAALSCLNIPFGTVLGVFTFSVLGRPTVQALFDAPTGLPAPPAPRFPPPVPPG